MNKTLLAINAKLEKMSKSEKKIAAYLTDDPSGILALSITELAEKCSCSEATVSRFSRRLGFTGYQGLKIALAQESGSENVKTDISGAENPADIYKSITNNIYLTLEKTGNILDFDLLRSVAEKILHSEKTVIFGLGNSAPVALDISHKLVRAGINATAYSDNHMQAIVASHLTENDVIILISHSGSSKDIVDSAKTSKAHNAYTVAVTGALKSPLSKACDAVFCTSSDETSRNILALNSRIAQLAIFDTIYYYLVNNNESLVDAIHETEKALTDTKY